MRWDTKPDNRIRRTSPHPAPTRIRSYWRAITLSAGDEDESGTPVTLEHYCLRFV
jgi:hypothetical protein